MTEEEQEEVKKELIAIKDIFVNREEEEDVDQKEEKDMERRDGETKDNGDLSSQIGFHPSVCRSELLVWNPY